MSLRELLRLQRKQLAAIIEVRGVRRMHRLYSESQGELQRKLRSLERAHKGQAFSAYHLRQVLAQVADGVKILEGKLGGHMRSTGRLAASLAPRHLARSIRVMEKNFTGTEPLIRVDEAGVFQKIMKDVEPSLLDRYEVSRKLYGPPVIAKTRDALSMSILQNETIDAAVDRVDGVIGAERWRAERIVRTEMAYSYGLTNQVAMEETKKDVPGLRKKLIETMDARTGDDSKELHGQVVDVDQPFIWEVKNSKGVPTGEIVEYMQPPNRPNDRAVVIPWRDDWPESATTEPLA
jgi:hypothetical protein